MAHESTIVPAQQAKRFRELVQAIGAELGERRGWISEAARMMGLHRSTISKVLRDDRSVTPALIARACDQLHLSPEFFTAKNAAASEWREFSTLMRGPREPDREALAVLEALNASKLIGAKLREGAVSSGDVDAFLAAIQRVPYLSRLRRAARGPAEREHALRAALDFEGFTRSVSRAADVAKFPVDDAKVLLGFEK